MSDTTINPDKEYAKAFAAYKAGMKGKAASMCDTIMANYPNTTASTAAENLRRQIGNPRDVAEVRVVDVDISFQSMIWLMIKAAIAAVPATIILVVLGVFVVMILSMLGISLTRSPF